MCGCVPMGILRFFVQKPRFLMRYYSKDIVARIVHDGAVKCRRNIELSRNEKELDGAIGLCNTYGSTIVSILNNEDYRFITEKFNIHRKWCSETFNSLQAVVTELDNLITERKEKLSRETGQDGRIGFNS